MIRLSRASEIDDIMTLWLEANLQAHDFVPKEYWLSHYDEVKTEIAKGVFVYEQDGRIFGFIGLIGNYVAGLFVRTDKRRVGIGTSLIEFCKEQNPILELHVFEKNTGAVSFYEKNEFKKIHICLAEEIPANEIFMRCEK
ncbi:MAG: GNAT family N-acetyltransferase [Alphaproteobacteria bacterium]